MNTPLWKYAFCALSLFIPASIGFAQANDPGPYLAKKVARSIFLIENEEGWGTGVLFGDANTIITNKHLVYDPEVGGSVQTVRVYPVTLNSKGIEAIESSYGGTVRWLHPQLDLAVIEVPGIPNTEPLTIAQNKAHTAVAGQGEAQEGHAGLLPRGSTIWAHGFPTIGSPMISRGIISGYFQYSPDATFYLTDTPLALGSSGGPVTDSEGGLLGIVTAVASDDAVETGFNWGYVVPVIHALEIFEGSHNPFGRVGVQYLPTSFNLRGAIAAIQKERRLANRIDLALSLFQAGAADAQTGDSLADMSRLIMDATLRPQKNLPVSVNDITQLNQFVFEFIEIQQTHLFLLSHNGAPPSATKIAEAEEAGLYWEAWVQEILTEGLVSGRFDIADINKMVDYGMRNSTAFLKNAQAKLEADLKPNGFWSRYSEVGFIREGDEDWTKHAVKVIRLASGIFLVGSQVSGLDPTVLTGLEFSTSRAAYRELKRELARAREFSRRLPPAAQIVFDLYMEEAENG